MPITTMSDLQNGYRAMRQVIEEHPDSETMKRRFEQLYAEFRQRSHAARQGRVELRHSDGPRFLLN